MFITLSPAFLAVIPALSWTFGIYDDIPWFLQNLLEYFSIFGLAPLYIVARIVLLVVAFRSLSSIPATGHQSIEWADFIPHI
jgi:hypothetical protein